MKRMMGCRVRGAAQARCWVGVQGEMWSEVQGEMWSEAWGEMWSEAWGGRRSGRRCGAEWGGMGRGKNGVRNLFGRHFTNIVYIIKKMF